MRTFGTLLVIVMLLVPSSLGAVVFAFDQCQTLAAEAEMSCCCAHEEPSQDSGPYLESSCCCEVKTPPEPLQEPVLPRDLGEGAPECAATSESANAEAEFGFEICSDLAPCHRGPPRAPPRPLFLQHQRFLI